MVAATAATRQQESLPGEQTAAAATTAASAAALDRERRLAGTHALDIETTGGGQGTDADAVAVRSRIYANAKQKKKRQEILVLINIMITINGHTLALIYYIEANMIFNLYWLTCAMSSSPLPPPTSCVCVRPPASAVRMHHN